MSGIASEEPHLPGQAAPISLEDAIATVDRWTDGFGPFPLHQVAIALRRGLVAERDLRLHNSETLRDLDAAHAQLIASLGTLPQENADLIQDRNGWGDRCQEMESQRDEACEALAALQADHAKLQYQARQMGAALIDTPDGYGSPQDGYPLSRVLDLMDCWRDDVEQWGLHQMCRVLREAMFAAQDFVELVEGERQRLLAMWIASEQRVLAAIPCARAAKDCSGPSHPYAPCCNLRVALLPGEPFEVDMLEDGVLHLFAPADPANPRAPRQSAGCIKMIEPTLPTVGDERNETLDWDFKHRYLG